MPDSRIVRASGRQRANGLAVATHGEVGRDRYHPGPEHVPDGAGVDRLHQQPAIGVVLRVIDCLAVDGTIAMRR